jgi:ABC-type nickel/cobalt efflux system permease component RcnA
LRFAARSLFKRFAAAIMMVAVIAFTFQATFIAPSEGGTEETSLYHHGFARSHAHQEAHPQEVAHVHADGTAHRHAIDDDDDLNEHIQEPGCPCCWNMAIVVGVLPAPASCTVALALGARFAIEAPAPYRDTEPNGPRRPPRPPSIA